MINKRENKLNDLSGKEWIKFTKSWFIHRPPRRKEEEMLHPAKFPESLIEEFISFFTKKGEWVLDPFLGTGSTLLAAGNLGRNAVGIELKKNYYKTSLKRIKKNNYSTKLLAINGDSRELKFLLEKNNLRNIKFNYAITSPPYWNQLNRNSIRQKEREKKGLETKYSSSKKDISNIATYEDFIEVQSKIFDNVYDLMEVGGYLTIITNNVYTNGKLYPLAFDTAIALTKRGNKSWVLKDEKIWLQDDKKLIALGIYNAWVGNRHHQYCLIFRKENE
ncbi:DNA methyltransferase [Melioribacteraceae bacterium 4301-Me]|uniref:DNA methyltransferase n=1 Tax=Pyranulibacter aquaticus TaxID=3163344 RepID=UPI003598C0FC